MSENNNSNFDRALDVISETALSFKSHNLTPPHVTIFGSARFKPGNHHYDETVKLARILSKAGWPIMSGGGPGIMEAANQGATEGGSLSMGATIKLPFEQKGNDFLQFATEHKYFFVRKYFLMTKARGIVAFPGGFGTLDEINEYLTLVQCKKIKNDVPVVLVSKSFWEPFVNYLKNTLLAEGTISEEDLKLIHIVDSADEAAEFLLDQFQKHGITPPAK